MVFNDSTMPSVHDPSHPVHRVRKEMKDFNDYYDEYFGPDRCKRKESNNEKLATLRAELNQADAAYDEQGADLKKAEDENAKLKKQLSEAKKSLDVKQKELETQKKKDADLLKAAEQENTTLKNQRNQAKDAKKSLEGEKDKLKKQVKDLQAQIKKDEVAKKQGKEEHRRLQGEIETLKNAQKAKDAYCKQLQEKLEEAEKKEEERKSALDQVQELSRQLQGAQEGEQNLNQKLEYETSEREKWYSKFEDIRARTWKRGRDLNLEETLATVHAPFSSATQPSYQHGNTQPGQTLPAQNIYPAQNTYPAPVPPSGPAQTNQNMHQRYRNFSDPHPRVNSTTNTTQDTSGSRSSAIPRDNNPGPSRRKNQNSSGPDPKANNTRNTAKDTSEPPNYGISGNNNPGPSSSGPTLANSVYLEYIWFTDPADSKPYESIRVSRGTESNVVCQVPDLDYVWAASVDNLQSVINMYNRTPGNKASIIMAKHVDVSDTERVRLDWGLFKRSLGQ
ncbi:unnamed protein product [Fusarium equiseti]|uniref:Uncharacterized protein n=1 Tax=Fusarium equiseti TaxID=61235 RepID=A0A8J2IK58_FUSEQ|nr:unnamed protein product [Fusarium equiseti]